MKRPETSATGTCTRACLFALARYFLRLGATGFGGPVALCGLMERDLVERRGWLTPAELRDMIAVCQSMPGPLAVQVGIFVGYRRRGVWGAWVAGVALILPAGESGEKSPYNQAFEKLFVPCGSFTPEPQ